MLKRIPLLISAFLLLAIVASAQVEDPTLTPVASTPEQEKLIREGVALHDQRDYDGAIRKYEEVLKQNPDNVVALYEMAYSYSEKKDFKKSVETASRGARYKSPVLPQFYLVLGNSLDAGGEPKKAVEVFKRALKLVPDDGLIYFNLAVTYMNLGKTEDAIKTVKRAASVTPNFSSSHYLLANLYYKEGYKIPSLLATCRFLVLEPNTRRSETAHRAMLQMLRGNVSRGDNAKSINIFIDPSAKKDEGDFGGVDLALSLMGAASMTDENKDKTQSQRNVDQLEVFFAILGEQSSKKNQSKFVWKYYVPYFTEMTERKFVEPFYYYVSRSKGEKEVKDWLEANFRRVNDFLSWSKQYQWPQEN